MGANLEGGRGGEGGKKQVLECRGEAGMWLSGPQTFHAKILSIVWCVRRTTKSGRQRRGHVTSHRAVGVGYTLNAVGAPGEFQAEKYHFKRLLWCL